MDFRHLPGPFSGVERQEETGGPRRVGPGSSAIRRMKPLGFTLEQIRDLLDATDRLDHAETADGTERDALLERVRTYEQDASRKIEELLIQLARAEDFAATLRTRLDAAHPMGAPA